MQGDIYVVKRDGSRELFDPDKIHEAVSMACKGITGVSISTIEINAGIQLIDGVQTSQIQNILIRSAHELIDEHNPNYQYVAARLLNQKLRKEVYKQYEPREFLRCVKQRVEQGYYDEDIFKYYTEDEIEYFGSKIKYFRDEEFTYAGLLQLYNAYLIKDKNGVPIETPQEVFMLIQMYAFRKYPKKERRKWVLEGYKIHSTHQISWPTPTMIGMRGTFRRFISCNLINAGDTTISLCKAADMVMRLTASRSGIGLNPGFIRGLGADIDGGRVKHTGITPILKVYEAGTKSFSQQTRGGSSNNNYPFFHYEIEDIIVLKNNKGTEENRVRHADHTIHFNKFFFERWYKDEDITLFHMNHVPGLYNCMGDYEKFKRLYEHYEKTVPDKNKKTIKASKLWDAFTNEIYNNGRVYTVLSDAFVGHSAFIQEKAPINMTNLCCEISVPATSLDPNEPTAVVNDNGELEYKYLQPEVGVCILGSVNWGQVPNIERLEVICEYMVRFLEELIDYQEYATPEVEYAAKKRRTLGIGISDLFHFLAKHKVFYNTKEARNLVHKWAEHFSYYLIRASNRLAKERGACELFEDTKYSIGQLPIDTYAKRVDELVDVELELDWDGLREDILKYGMRHSTLMAIAPTSSSSVVSSSTPGIEPPRKLINVKEDKKAVYKVVVPEFHRLKNYYTTAWEIDNIDYIKFVAVLQKFIDQAISTNRYIDYTRYPDRKVPKAQIDGEYAAALKYGIKTFYYINFRTDNAKEEIEEEDEGCAGGGCKI